MCAPRPLIRPSQPANDSYMWKKDISLRKDCAKFIVRRSLAGISQSTAKERSQSSQVERPKKAKVENEATSQQLIEFRS